MRGEDFIVFQQFNISPPVRPPRLRCLYASGAQLLQALNCPLTYLNRVGLDPADSHQGDGRRAAAHRNRPRPLALIAEANGRIGRTQARAVMTLRRKSPANPGWHHRHHA